MFRTSRSRLWLLVAVVMLGRPPSSFAVNVSVPFDGLSIEDDTAIAGVAVLPPDNGFGVGTDNIFQMVNVLGRLSDKLGGSISSFTLRSFFGLDAGFSESDPRVIYDAASGRWFGTYLQYSFVRRSSSIVLAVSTTGDPTGTFCRYRLGNPTSESFLQDFPIVGASDDKVVVTYNGFSFITSGFVGAGTYVLNKADLLGQCGTPLRSVRVAPDRSSFTLHPTQSLGGVGDLYVAMHPLGSSSLILVTISGTPGVTPVTTTSVSLPIRAWAAPPEAQQAGSGVLLQTNDDRVVSVAWQKNSLWLAGNEACTPPGDTSVRSCLRVIEIRTDTSTVRQDMTFGATGQYYYYPAVCPDRAGNLHVVFTSSSASSFAGVWVTSRRASDALNTLQPSIEIRAGVGPQTHPSGRMGDYSGAAVDPSAPLSVWVSGEVIGRPGATTLWRTFVARLRVPNPAPAAAPDFDGDAIADVGVFRPGTGIWHIVRSRDGAVRRVQWGVSDDILVPGDYDGDGQADVAVWRPSNGIWYIIRSSDGAVQQIQWGVSGDQPVPRDYDGDGKADVAVYRPSTGTWWVLRSSDRAVQGIQLGAPGDVPVPGDYDGDGLADVAVWGASNGIWQILRSSDGALQQVQWGISGDLPVARDYDGDGKTDVAVFRPNTGAWYIVRSSDGAVRRIAWGMSGDVPVARDYDGDGKADVAVYRPSTGMWYVRRSSDGALQQNRWGGAGDLPLSP